MWAINGFTHQHSANTGMQIGMGFALSIAYTRSVPSEEIEVSDGW
jgi:hypothetical protein